MATLGDLVVNLTAKNLDLQRKLKQAQSDMQRTGNSAGNMAKQVKLSTGQMNQNLSQLSFAAQDMASVMSAGGSVGQGLNSMSNNIGTLLTTMHPLAGVAAGVGLSLAGVFTKGLFDANTGLTESESRVNALTNALRELERQTSSAAQLQAATIDIREIESSESASSALKTREKESKRLRQQRIGLEKQLEEVQRQFGIGSVNEYTKRVSSFTTKFDTPEKQFEASGLLKYSGAVGYAVEKYRKYEHDSVYGVEQPQERFKSLDETAQQEVVGKFLELQEKLKDVAEQSRITGIEIGALTLKQRELSAAEKLQADAAEKAAASKRAEENRLKEDADRVKESQQQYRESGQLQKRAESLLAQASPMEDFRQKLIEIENLAVDGAITPEEFDTLSAHLMKSASSKLATETTAGTPKPELLSGLQRDSKSQLDRVLQAGLPPGKDPQKELNATAKKQLETMKQLLAQAKQRRDVAQQQVVIGALD